MKSIFILILIHRGLIQEPEIFYNSKDAEKRKADIQMNGFNSDYDEIEVFEKVI